MKYKIILAACALMLPYGAWGQAELKEPASRLPGMAVPEPPRFSRYYFILGGGAAIPFGGHWGDTDAGFKPSPAITAAGAKKANEMLSYGLEASCLTGHKSRSVPEMKLRIVSFTPFLRASYQGSGKTYYGMLGAGIYSWTQPAFSAGGADHASDSGSSFGVNMGGGVVYPLWDGLQLGLDLRWHHIFTMRGENFDVRSADNLVPSVFCVYGF
ncbi:MAG: hypothetical protein WCW52_12315 [Elusimicrobiales bacterium]|jgi:hypothetical protein